MTPKSFWIKNYEDYCQDSADLRLQRQLHFSNFSCYFFETDYNLSYHPLVIECVHLFSCFVRDMHKRSYFFFLSSVLLRLHKLCHKIKRVSYVKVVLMASTSVIFVTKYKYQKTKSISLISSVLNHLKIR